MNHPTRSRALCLSLLMALLLAWSAPVGAEAPGKGKKISGKELLEKCQAGDPASCHMLAMALRQAKGKNQNLPLARKLLQMACSRDHLKSCDVLGVMLIAGQGGDKNVKGGALLLGKACNGGVAHACYNLGAILYHGQLGKKDLPAARKHFTSACASKSVDACANLALMMFRGEGGPKLRKEAVPLFEQTCKRGSKMACKVLQTVEVKAMRQGGGSAPAAGGGKASKAGGKKKNSVSFKNVKLNGDCGVGLFAAIGLLSGVQKQLLPCLPAGAAATVTMVTKGGKLKKATVTPGGKQGACVKKAVRKLKAPGGKGTCTLGFTVSR